MAIGFDATVSAISASALRHDVTAHDVANVNTPGFEQSTPHQVEMSPEGVRISSVVTTPNRDPFHSGTDLAEEAKEQIVNKNTYSANMRVLRSRDRMTGEVINLVA